MVERRKKAIDHVGNEGRFITVVAICICGFLLFVRRYGLAAGAEAVLYIYCHHIRNILAFYPMKAVVVIFARSSAWAQSMGDGTGFVSSLNFTFQHASALASVLSLKNLAKSDLIDWASGATHHESGYHGSNCGVHDSYNGCLIKCPDDTFRQGVLNSTSAIQTLCANRQEFSADDKDCVQKFTPHIQQVWQKQNELLLATTKQLQEARNSTTSLFGNLASIFQRLCQSAMNQVDCVGNSLHQKCGDGAYDLIKKIFQASLGSVKSLVGDKEGAVPVQCKQLFNAMVTQKNGSIALVFLEDLLPTTTATSAVAEATSSVAVATTVNANMDYLDPTGSANGEFFRLSRWIVLFFVVLFMYVTMGF